MKKRSLKNKILNKKKSVSTQHKRGTCSILLESMLNIKWIANFKLKLHTFIDRIEIEKKEQ